MEIKNADRDLRFLFSTREMAPFDLLIQSDTHSALVIQHE